MFPRGQHFDHLFRDLAFLEEHPENLVLENGFQLLKLQRRRDPEHPLISIDTSVRHEDVAVGIEAEKVTERLHGDDRAGEAFLFRHGLLHEDFQRVPGAAAEACKKLLLCRK